MTASEATYAVVINGPVSEGKRDLTGMGVGLDGIIVTNGTPCDNEVSIQVTCNISSAIIIIVLEESVYSGKFCIVQIWLF